jgi:hypothetical protein
LHPAQDDDEQPPQPDPDDGDDDAPEPLPMPKADRSLRVSVEEQSGQAATGSGPETSFSKQRLQVLH